MTETNWDTTMKSLARDLNHDLFDMAIKRNKKWDDTCFDIVREAMETENEQLLRFIYPYFQFATKDDLDTKTEFFDEFIPLLKIKLFPTICDIDNTMLPQFICLICKYHSYTLLEIFQETISKDFDTTCTFLIQSCVYNRPHMLSRALTLYYSEKFTEIRETEKDAVIELTCKIAAERDIYPILEILLEHVKDNSEIMQEVKEILQKMQHSDTQNKLVNMFEKLSLV